MRFTKKPAIESEERMLFSWPREKPLGGHFMEKNLVKIVLILSLLLLPAAVVTAQPPPGFPGPGPGPGFPGPGPGPGFPGPGPGPFIGPGPFHPLGPGPFYPYPFGYPYVGPYSYPYSYPYVDPYVGSAPYVPRESYRRGSPGACSRILGWANEGRVPPGWDQGVFDQEVQYCRNLMTEPAVPPPPGGGSNPGSVPPPPE